MKCHKYQFCLLREDGPTKLVLCLCFLFDIRGKLSIIRYDTWFSVWLRTDLNRTDLNELINFLFIIQLKSYKIILSRPWVDNNVCLLLNKQFQKLFFLASKKNKLKICFV